MKYKLKISKRARYMRLEIKRSGELVVTAPYGIDLRFVERFLSQKSDWIKKTKSYFDLAKSKATFLSQGYGKTGYKKYKEKARILAENRISFYNKFYNFKINRVSIKNTKSRWGSCSKKGNLNFNYKITLLPLELADYVIVHELCHLQELNHSKKFWKLVALTLPNYKELRLRFRI